LSLGIGGDTFEHLRLEECYRCPLTQRGKMLDIPDTTKDFHCESGKAHKRYGSVSVRIHRKTHKR